VDQDKVTFVTLCFDLKTVVFVCTAALEVREGVERWVEEEEKENNAMLEYRRRANNKIGLAQKMKDRIGRWTDGGASENRGDREWVWACGDGFMQKGLAVPDARPHP
jgi:hypothetical protein